MNLPHLTHYELELMDVLWRKGGATTREVCESLKRTLAYTTVSTTLMMLHKKKKVLDRQRRGVTHVYTPKVAREEVIRATINQLWDPLFAAHPIGLILALFNSGDFTKLDLKALKDGIQECERGNSV